MQYFRTIIEFKLIKIIRDKIKETILQTLLSHLYARDKILNSCPHTGQTILGSKVMDKTKTILFSDNLKIYYH